LEVFHKSELDKSELDKVTLPRCLALAWASLLRRGTNED
jgi:hypothetical protein